MASCKLKIWAFKTIKLVVENFRVRIELKYHQQSKYHHHNLCLVSLNNSLSLLFGEPWSKQCRINHMAEAAYATGPALLGAPRFWGPRAYSLLFFPEFFCSMFQCETQTVRQCGALKSSSPPENARAPKFKKRGPIKLGPNVFLFPVSVFQRGAPKSPRSSENIRTQNLKIEVPNSRAQNGFFVSCFSAGSKQCEAPKSPRPLKAKPQNKKNTRPQSLKSEAPKAGPQTIFFVPSLAKGLQRARPKKS